jgi:hypothetical protein
MFRMSAMIVLACSSLVPIGCKGEAGTGNESGTGGRMAEAARADVTLHVADMTERQGLT